MRLFLEPNGFTGRQVEQTVRCFRRQERCRRNSRFRRRNCRCRDIRPGFRKPIPVSFRRAYGLRCPTRACRLYGRRFRPDRSRVRSLFYAAVRRRTFPYRSLMMNLIFSLALSFSLSVRVIIEIALDQHDRCALVARTAGKIA